jgi:hypothetical protein
MPVPAGIIGYGQTTAVVALIDMPSQKGRPTAFNGLHGPELIRGEAVGFSVVVSMSPKNIGHLHGGLRHWRLDRDRGLGDQLIISRAYIQGTDDLGQVMTADMEIDGGRGRRSVTQK